MNSDVVFAKEEVAMHIPQIMGGVHLHAQMYPRTSYLRNGWKDCAESWCEVRDQLVMRFTQVRE